MRTFWHTLRGHRVLRGYYVGFPTGGRKCSCGAYWKVTL